MLFLLICLLSNVWKELLWMRGTCPYNGAAEIVNKKGKKIQSSILVTRQRNSRPGRPEFGFGPRPCRCRDPAWWRARLLFLPWAPRLPPCGNSRSKAQMYGIKKLGSEDRKHKWPSCIWLWKQWHYLNSIILWRKICIWNKTDDDNIALSRPDCDWDDTNLLW